MTILSLAARLSGIEGCELSWATELGVAGKQPAFTTMLLAFGNYILHGTPKLKVELSTLQRSGSRGADACL